MKVQLYQRVALKRDLPGRQLRAGDVAYFVDHVPDPMGCEVGCVPEVFNAPGESIAVVTIPESDIEPLSADEVLSIWRLVAS